MRPRTSDKVANYLEGRENQIIVIDEVVEKTGLTRSQVMSSVINLRNRVGYNLETRVKGYSYTYRGICGVAPVGQMKDEGIAKTEHIRRMFEEIGTLKNGALIIRADTGSLWRAEEML
jgi:biotin operon repressor